MPAAVKSANKQQGKAKKVSVKKRQNKRSLKSKQLNKTQKKRAHKFQIDCSLVVKDGILDASDFANFLKNRIKVDGKVNNLGETVSVTLGEKKDKIQVVAHNAFSKRYLKYLSKKYLKKHQMRDFLQVVATNKASYEFKYFNIQQDNEEEEGN